MIHPHTLSPKPIRQSWSNSLIRCWTSLTSEKDFCKQSGLFMSVTNDRAEWDHMRVSQLEKFPCEGPWGSHQEISVFPSCVLVFYPSSWMVSLLLLRHLFSALLLFYWQFVFALCKKKIVLQIKWKLAMVCHGRKFYCDAPLWKIMTPRINLHFESRSRV